jgi:hypothetical protein
MHGDPRASVSNSALTCLNQCSIEAMKSSLSGDLFTLLTRQPHDTAVSDTVGASHINPRLEVLIACKANRVMPFGMEIIA